MGPPTHPNRTGVATVSDSVQTPIEIAKLMVNSFPLSGHVLEPASGEGNIYTSLYDLEVCAKLDKISWCEIEDGVDFFDWHERVNWIVTNPPYSIYDKFLVHCFEVADNVVFLCPIAKAFKSMKIERLVDDYGGLREIHLIGSGQKCGFAFGFPTGFLWYQRGYKGDIRRVVKNK